MSLLGHTADPSRSIEATSPLMWVELNQLNIQCIIGIYDFERHSPQDIVVDIALGLKHEHWLLAAHKGLLEHSLDYARIAQQLTELCQSAQFRLLESLYLVIARLFLETAEYQHRVEIEALRLKISKPCALSASRVPVPSLSGQMNKHQCHTFFSTLSPPPTPLSQPPLLNLSSTSRSQLKTQTLIELPEVCITRLSSAHAGDFKLIHKDCSVIPLSMHVKNRAMHFSWSEPLVALYIERRSFIPEYLP